MSFLHIPGPWHIEETKTGWIVGASGSTTGTYYIADVHKHTVISSDKQSAANAYLIGIAPDLDLYRHYVEDNMDRMHEGWVPVCFGEYQESEEIENDRQATNENN